MNKTPGSVRQVGGSLFLSTFPILMSSCTHTDYQTGKTEKTSTCDDDEAVSLRDDGW
jgi:hypothetical protein